jgi:hypothetical protein
VEPFTAQLWEKQNRHPGDRARLFGAVQRAIQPTRVLYPGSYVDIAASVVFSDVTYVDMDRRAARFFADSAGVQELLAAESPDTAHHRFHFLHADYQQPLDLAPASFDLLVSLYAGFVSDSCSAYLAHGGTLLATPSHGDAALASLNPGYTLVGIVDAVDDDYRVSTEELDSHLVPKRPGPVAREEILRSGRGVAYTRSPVAYLFRWEPHS